MEAAHGGSSGPVRFERMKIGGADALLAPRPGTGLLALAAIIRRGSADEREGEHGLASFTASMLLRGTQRRSSEQIAFDLESLGAIAGEGDGMDTCSLNVRCSAEAAPRALEILFESLREPAFDAREHEVHRQELLAHLRMIEDEKFSYTYREYVKAMFTGHGYGHASEGELADAERITPADCRRWHAEMIRPETLLIAAVGDFEVGALRDLLAGLLADWPVNDGPVRPRIATQPPADHPRELELRKPELNQGFIVGGFRTPPITDPDYAALRLGSAALGEGFAGRIFTELREKRSLAYALGATLRSYRLTGHQVLYIGTKPESIEEARAGLLREADYLKHNLLSDEELNRAREYVLGKFVMGQQSHAQRVSHLAWWEDAAGDAAEGWRYPERLRGVTAAQVREAARKWWVEPTMAVLRPEAG
ncbi:MAG: Peptidase M16 inactive domain protein [candidate division BRC1 bacterium ADurb.BinA292]|nr:MAG: Peptidase M16 inactive domain protein [candidate division BRC1 bacterium ADurb.BinA292]